MLPSFFASFGRIFTPFIETRHACEQGDELKGYTWTEHDVRYGGIQVLNDTLNNVQITTEWLKEPGGDNGGSWAARIKGRPLLHRSASDHTATPHGRAVVVSTCVVSIDSTENEIQILIISFSCSPCPLTRLTSTNIAGPYPKSLFDVTGTMMRLYEQCNMPPQFRRPEDILL